MAKFWDTAILVRLYAFNCFGYFCVTDGQFIDFMIVGDYICSPRCMSFWSLCGIVVSYEVYYFLGKPKFWFCFMLSIVLVVFRLGIDDLCIS